MSLGTFQGGVHPYDGKELSKSKALRPVLPKRDLAFLLSQHIGAPAKPIVSVGDQVKVGQKIAEAGGFVSASIYSSVSGTVKKIEPRRTATGAQCDAIIIANDNQYEEVEYPKRKPVDQMSGKEIIDAIREAGVVGMGGAGFPTHVKLSPKAPDQIDVIIANCAECEPYITADYRRMMEHPKELIEGLKIILKLFDQAKAVLGIEDNKPDCIKTLTDLTKNEKRIEVKALKTKYPQGSERQLIYAVTGRKVNSSMLPADAGCIVDNVETIIAVYRAVAEGKPLMERTVTITGPAIAEPSNFLAKIGTSFEDLIEEAGGFSVPPIKCISGGPMMGFALFQTDFPVTKTSSALLCLTRDEVAEGKQTNCINCGRCVSVCPSRIVPSRLAKFAEHDDMEAFERWNGLECVNCGSCSYVCL